MQSPSSQSGHQTSDGLEIWRISHIPQKDGELDMMLISCNILIVLTCKLTLINGHQSFKLYLHLQFKFLRLNSHFLFFCNTSAGRLFVPGVLFVSSQYFGWIDNFTDILLVPEGAISPVVNPSVLTWLIRYTIFIIELYYSYIM